MDVSRARDGLGKIKRSGIRKKLRMLWGENLQNSTNGGGNQLEAGSKMTTGKSLGSGGGTRAFAVLEPVRGPGSASL